MGSTEHNDGNMHDHVMLLTQRLVAEADRVSAAFVASSRMHATDVNALIRVLVGQQQGESITAGRLGEELGLTSGAITAVVDRLERSGHLRRVRDQQDRRRVLLENSPAGQRLAEKYFAPIRQRSEGVMDTFTSDELEVIGRYLAATAAEMAAHREFLVTATASGAASEK